MFVRRLYLEPVGENTELSSVLGVGVEDLDVTGGVVEIDGVEDEGDEIGMARPDGRSPIVGLLDLSVVMASFGGGNGGSEVIDGGLDFKGWSSTELMRDC